MNDTNNDLINKIILIKEALNPKYIYYERYLKEYDKRAYNMLNNKEGLTSLLNSYENKCTYKGILNHLDSPEIRYLYFMTSGFHEAQIFNVEYTKKALYIYLDGHEALCWPNGMKSKIILEFKGAKDVYVDKIPSFFDGNKLQLADKSFAITISSTCKSCSFNFKDVKFIDVD